MPPTAVHYYRDDEGTLPVRSWLLTLRLSNRKAFAKCMIRIQRLRQLGFELRRPEGDLLRDGIYELRVRDGSVNYRILYFFHNRGITVLAHAPTKEDRVPPAEIDRAIRRKRAFETAPADHLGMEIHNEA